MAGKVFFLEAGNERGKVGLELFLGRFVFQTQGGKRAFLVPRGEGDGKHAGCRLVEPVVSSRFFVKKHGLPVHIKGAHGFFKPKHAFIVASLFCLVVASSCFLGDKEGTKLYRCPGSGASLVRYGSRAYVAGGRDAAGHALSRVMSAVAGTGGAAPGGAVGAFSDEPDLPEALCHASMLGAGRMLYVLGGETVDGTPSSAIRYTYINDDGSLGFGADRHWETNPVPLPEARSCAAVVLHDGWIYLIGGTTAGGATDSIIRARVYQDGQVGMWYPAATLPEPAILAAAVYYKGFFFVSGGVSGFASGNRVLDSFCSFELGARGALCIRRDLPSLLEARFGSSFVIEGETLLLAGGFASNLQGSDKVFRFSDGAWSLVPGLSIGAEGASGRVGGALLYIPHCFDGRSLGSIALNLGPEAPEALPGSGKVPDNSPLVFLPEPGTVLRYALNGAGVTAASPLYSPSSPPRISSAASPPVMSISLASFVIEGTSPSITKYEYEPTRLGFFVRVTGELSVVPATKLSPGFVSCPEGALGWFRIRIARNGEYVFRIGNPGGAAVSLVERDLLTDVPGFALTDGESPAIWLQAGTYFTITEVMSL